MKIEDQVSGIDQSKKLRELGVEKESIYKWFRHNNKYASDIPAGEWVLIPYQHEAQRLKAESYTAYTVAELGEMLPLRLKGFDEDIMGPDYYYMLSFKDFPDGWRCEYGDLYTTYTHKTEAQARAEALIWLIENQHINPKEL